MSLDVRVAQTTLEDALRDAVLFALGKRLPAVASVAALRAVATQGQTGPTLDDDALVNIVVSGSVVTAYRFSTTSTSADDGATVVKPADVFGAGRWLAWTSPLKLAPVIGGPSYFLHQLQDGPLERVIVLDKDTDKDEMTQLLSGAVPAVAIDARGDRSSPLTQNTGHKKDRVYDFVIYTVAKNLRSRREAAQGSTLDGDLGANAIDGLIEAVLDGTGLYAVVDGVRDARAGSGANWVSDLAQRRVIRSRDYEILATVEYPPAPNDTGPMDELEVQEQTAELRGAAADPDNFVTEGGILVALGLGLSHSVSPGSATIAGVVVNYAGQLATFPASSDTYRDLKADGTLVFQSVPLDGEPPPLTAGAIRVGVTRTDSASVTDDNYVAPTKRDFGPAIRVPVGLADLASLTVTPTDTESLAISGTQQLKATGIQVDGTVVDETATATWSSSDTTVVTVSSTGLVTAVGHGTAYVYATVGGQRSNGAAFVV